MTVRRARGHMNISWWCNACGKRNRTHADLNSGDYVEKCDHCNEGALDLIPAQGEVYAGSLGVAMRESEAS